MFDARESMWVAASRDDEAERNSRIFSLAKVSAQQTVWAFLSAARSLPEYDARYELVADRVSSAVDQVSAGDTALLDQIRTSLKDDWGLLQHKRDEIRLQALAADWAGDDGELHSLAITGGYNADALAAEVTELARYASADERTELAELHRLAVGREPNFPKQADASYLTQQYQGIDPSDVPPGQDFNHAAFEAGQTDGYYGDNAGVEEFGHDPSYQKGLEDGRESAGEDKQQPGLVHGGTKIAVAHPPYYITESDGKFKVVDAIGDVRGTFDSKDAAREQQKALYANVPGAAEKAEDKHDDPRPAAVQEQGRKPAVKATKVVTANQYIEKRGDEWVILQKGTGKVLSHHDSEEKANEAFRGMMWNKHKGEKWGFLDKEGIFHEVAVNEDAYGADRYEHVEPPATPSWIADEFNDHQVVPLGNTPAENHADGTEMNPTAPWLVAEESLRPSTNTTGGLSWRVPTTLTITADNPFASTPSTNQFIQPGPAGADLSGGTGTMPSPDDDPAQVGLAPDATDPAFTSDTSTMLPGGGAGGVGDVSNMSPAAAPAGSLDSMPAPEDDTTSSPTTPFTGSRFTRAGSLIDRIAASVKAANPGLGLTQCVTIAQRTVSRHPELQTAGQR